MADEYEIKKSGNTATSQHITGAGFLVIRSFGNIYKILGLYQNGRYDVPKGHIERNESPLEAAFREAEEEAAITRLTFNWGLEHIVINDRLILYVAVTNQDGEIRPNPETGMYEHDEAQWLTFDDMYANCIPFLRPGVIWAKGKLFEVTRDPRYLVRKGTGKGDFYDRRRRG